MRLFFELAARSFRRTLTYRIATLAGLITNVFFGLIRASVLVALFGQQSEVSGYTVTSIITYTGLSQALIAYLMLFGWYDLMDGVHTGEISTQLLKPLSLFRYWLAHDLGRAIAHLFLRGVSIMLIYELMFDLTYPKDLGQWLALLVSLFFAWWLSMVWRFLVNLAAFWSPNAQGFGRLLFFAANFFSGFMMPLGLFPDWLQTLCYLTPFPYMINVVIEIYLNIITGSELVFLLALQLIWILGLSLISQFILTMGIRKLAIAGG